MTDGLRVLLIEDDENYAGMIERMLRKRIGSRLQFAWADWLSKGLKHLASEPSDIVLLDLGLPDSQGFDTFVTLQERVAQVPIIVLTGLDDEALAVETIQKGGQDYLVKGQFDSRLLARAIRYAIQRKQMEQALRQMNETLEQQVAERTRTLEAEIAERKRAEAWLLEQRQQLRALSARLAQVEEAERRRLAGILHDQAGQNLTALGINLRIVRTQLPVVTDQPELIQQLVGRLDDCLALIKETTGRIRKVMDDLRPPALEEYGLLAALRWYGDAFSAQTNLTVAIHGAEPMARLSPLKEITLFRIAQEALTNVARHAQATKVSVNLDIGQNVLRMVVSDDGIGFDPDCLSQPGERHCWGLSMMVERAQAVGGTCRFESSPDNGAHVTVEVPR